MEKTHKHLTQDKPSKIYLLHAEGKSQGKLHGTCQPVLRKNRNTA